MYRARGIRETKHFFNKNTQSFVKKEHLILLETLSEVVLLMYVTECLKLDKMKMLFPRNESSHSMLKRNPEFYKVVKSQTERFRKSAIPSMIRISMNSLLFLFYKIQLSPFQPGEASIWKWSPQGREALRWCRGRGLSRPGWQSARSWWWAGSGTWCWLWWWYTFWLRQGAQGVTIFVRSSVRPFVRS